MTAERHPLGAGIVTLIVVDVVLVLVFLALLLQALWSGIIGSPGVGAGPVASATGTTEPTPGRTGTADPVAFASPSRNISCEISEGAVTCTIAQFSYAQPIVAGCDGLLGHDVRLTADGADWVCREGAAPGLASSGIPVLEYGSTTSVHGFTCASAPTGITCRHEATGRSVSLAKSTATLD